MGRARKSPEIARTSGETVRNARARPSPLQAAHVPQLRPVPRVGAITVEKRVGNHPADIPRPRVQVASRQSALKQDP